MVYCNAMITLVAAANGSLFKEPISIIMGYKQIHQQLQQTLFVKSLVETCNQIDFSLSLFSSSFFNLIQMNFILFSSLRLFSFFDHHFHCMSHIPIPFFLCTLFFGSAYFFPMPHIIIILHCSSTKIPTAFHIELTI